jgi:hypothetical protein
MCRETRVLPGPLVRSSLGEEGAAHLKQTLPGGLIYLLPHMVQVNGESHVNSIDNLMRA